MPYNPNKHQAQTQNEQSILITDKSTQIASIIKRYNALLEEIISIETQETMQLAQDHPELCKWQAGVEDECCNRVYAVGQPLREYLVGVIVADVEKQCYDIS